MDQCKRREYRLEHGKPPHDDMSWLVLQPDVQYITNPGGTNYSNAVVVGARVEFIF